MLSVVQTFVDLSHIWPMSISRTCPCPNSN